MAKIDIIKAEITVYQILMVLVFGVNTGLVGWIIQNEESSRLILAVMFAVLMSILLVVLLKTIFKKIKTLGDYNE